MAGNPAKRTQKSTTNTPAKQPGKVRICRICKRSFSTVKALADHRSATQHYSIHCPVCNKEFGSHEAVGQHTQVHSGLVVDRNTESRQYGARVVAESNLEELTALLSLQAPVIIPNTQVMTINNPIPGNDMHRRIDLIPKQQPPRRTDSFVYKSNTYTRMHPHEQEVIYAALLAACHTSAQLRAEQYTLPGLNKCRTNTNIHYSEFRKTPAPSPGEGKRKAIAIDCEMVGLYTGRACVALVSAVDVLTGEILLNTYVNPMSRVRNWRSQFSGVTRAVMDNAIKQGQALGGWKAARGALWKYIDAETIIVGHALHNDLNVLGMLHSRVVDTAILSAQAVFPEIHDSHFPRRWGLKRLSGYFLGSIIQTGKEGHDCLEDTLATRELVLWCLTYPERLMEWGQQARLEHDLKLLGLTATQA